MCGIVGYNGVLDAKEILLKGLEKLEYRGYDSAGIAVHNEEGVTVFKEKGRIADLRKAVDGDVEAAVGIGHTRWATHGVPNRLKCASAYKCIRSLYTCTQRRNRKLSLITKSIFKRHSNDF